MDKKLWLNSTFKLSWEKKAKELHSVPHWLCPHCEVGKLNINREELHYEESKQSLDQHAHIDWDYDYTRYRFHGSLRCAHCKDFITFLGKGYAGGMVYFDPALEEHVEETFDELEPQYFYPALKLISIPEKCPLAVRNEIMDSFSLFWSDTASCANKIRVSLELLMTHYKIPRSTISKKGKKTPLSLHYRITKFGLKHKETSEFLLAIKWIGNAGSHNGKMDREDLISAYELLEFSLHKLYDYTEKNLKRLSKEISKRKGKPRKSR